MTMLIEARTPPAVARHSAEEFEAEMQKILTEFYSWEEFESLSSNELLTARERAAYQRLRVLRFLLDQK